MLTYTLSAMKYLVRKVRNPLNKPEGAEKIKFTQQQITMFGSAARNERVSIEKGFKDKYASKFQQFEDQMVKKQLKSSEKKKTKTDRGQQLHNKQMPKAVPKQERVKPEQLTLSDLAQIRLGPRYLPTIYLKQVQKIFNKYGQTRLRDIAQNFSKLMTLRYKQQKLDYEQYKDLKFQRLEAQVPKEKKIQQIYLIGQQKIYDQNQFIAKQTRKTDEDPFSPQMSYTQNIVVSYLLNRAPRTYSTASRILTQIRYKYPNFKPKSFLDFGAGLAAGSCAFLDVFDSNGEVYGVEPSAKMRKLSKFLTEGMKIKHYQSLGEMSTQVKQVDIIYAGYVINQIKPQLVQVYLEALYSKTKNEGFLIFAEYGSPFGSRLIHQIRKWAIQKKMYIAAPCPHHLKCPLAKSKSWCHFDQPSGIYPQNVFGKLPTSQEIQYQKFSYLILQKKQQDEKMSQLDKNQPNVTKDWDRVLFPLIKRGRHVLLNLCTKEGTYQRRIAAKSHGPEYREIKKLRWGDLWRFGKRIPNKYRKQRKTGKRLW